MHTKWRIITLIFGAFGTFLGTYFGMSRALSPLMTDITNEMNKLGASIEAVRMNLEERAEGNSDVLLYHFELEEMLRNVRRMNCQLIPDYEESIACSMRILWPKEV